LGGRVKVIASGSAPLNPDMQKELQTLFCCPIRIGYGLTETMGIACVGEFDDLSVGVCGPPTPSCMMRLADWDEGNYRNSDKDDPNIGMPRGEVLIGGPLVTMGYFVDPDKPDPELEKKNTEEFINFSESMVGKENYGNSAFSLDGKPVRWFRTGDIGQINKNGVLQIVDRKKDLWKGPQGEYVSFTKVEGALKLPPLVDNAMVYGKVGGSFTVALLVPNPVALKALPEAKGRDNIEELSRDPSVVKVVEAACVKACKESKLNAFEIPKKFSLCADPWTPENDLLTAAQKMKRPAISKAYKAEIDAMYA